MKQTKDVRMYIEEFYSSRDLVTLLYKLNEGDEYWKNTGLYTLATKD